MDWKQKARRDPLRCPVRHCGRTVGAPPLPSTLHPQEAQECPRLGRICHGGRRARLAVAVEVCVKTGPVGVRPAAGSKPAQGMGGQQ